MVRSTNAPLLLPSREIVSLFLHFTVNPKPPVTFLDVPRCSMTGKEQTVNRFQQIESRWGYVKPNVGTQGRYLTTDDIFTGIRAHQTRYGSLSIAEFSLSVLVSTAASTVPSNTRF